MADRFHAKFEGEEEEIWLGGRELNCKQSVCAHMYKMEEGSMEQCSSWINKLGQEEHGMNTKCCPRESHSYSCLWGLCIELPDVSSSPCFTLRRCWRPWKVAAWWIWLLLGLFNFLPRVPAFPWSLWNLIQRRLPRSCYNPCWAELLRLGSEANCIAGESLDLYFLSFIVEVQEVNLCFLMIPLRF